MSSFAVVIVGVPARVSDDFLDEIRGEFPTGYVIRADGSSFRQEGLPSYGDVDVARALTACADAVFGKSTRPLSFCRRPTQACVLKSHVRSHRACGKDEHEACGLEKPDYLLVLYHKSKNDDPLLRALSFSAYARPLPPASYGKVRATAGVVKEEIRRAKTRLEKFRSMIKGDRRTPIMLPIKNFNPPALISVLGRVAAARDEDKAVQTFIERNWNQPKAAFINPSSLCFSPTVGTTSHGLAGASELVGLALASHYRLGCAYEGGFHYDVQHERQANLKGVAFQCSRDGDHVCVEDDAYANVYPNDFVRVRSKR